MAAKLSVVVMALLICACAEENFELAQRREIQAHTKIDIQADHSRYLFADFLKGVNSREHFVIGARFVKHKSSFTLHSHFNGYEYRDGVRIRVSRDQDEIWVECASPGFLPSRTELSNVQMNPDGTLRLRIEVHDGVSTGVRILIWNDVQSLQGELQRARVTVNESTADMDSRREGWVFESHGRGARWGIETEDVQLLTAYREAPYVH